MFKSHYRENSVEWQSQRQEWLNQCLLFDQGAFTSNHAPESEAYKLEWQTLCHSRGYLTGDEQWKRNNPVSFAAELNRRSGVETAPAQKAFIATPLQTATWKAQSEKFAELRGEIVSLSASCSS